MSSFTLGLVPLDFTVVLSPRASFVTALVAPEPWPDGTVIELRFADTASATTTWQADLDGPRAEWNRPRTDCAAVLEDGKTRVGLVCTDADGHELLWARGRVRVV